MDMKSVGQVIMIAGMLLTVIGGLGFLATANVGGPTRSDCMGECRVDGWQYRPKAYGGECWCEVNEGRPLTAEGE